MLIPLLFMGDVVGRLFREFAITLSITILISAVVSLTLVPMMAGRWLKSHKDAAHPQPAGRLQRVYDGVMVRYDHSLQWVLARQTLTLLVALLPVFLAFEVLFYGLLEVLSERTGELFPFWAVVSANTLAAASMGLYLWFRHPAFRRSIQETPLGAAPLH